jgi:hypothetical protein
MYKILFFLISGILFSISIEAQPGRWQQRVKYTMNIDVDANTNRFTGKQKLEYTNNSPDPLKKVFYHLYYNAFQPNSSMDVRSRHLGKTIINGRPDWDSRVIDRISKLKEDEIGYQKIISLKMNGVSQPFKYDETILEVTLTQPIAPKSKVVFEMEFEAQIPIQIRRTGRDNPTTGVRYSMSQWYPKICEYDIEGWHPTPYVAREFYGVWGDFDVTIAIDKNYKLGGTGVLVNDKEIGWGYDEPGSALKPTEKAKRSWHFVGNNVHDFVWAADPDYIHLVRKMPNGGPIFHVIYNYKNNDPKNDTAWNTVADAAVFTLPFVESKFGKYPYPQYSFIQGGDGGMEYPMATLLIGPSLGTVFHELMHTWYQMILGTNESINAWMDEGFADFSSAHVAAFYRDNFTRIKYKNNPAYIRSLDSAAALLPLVISGSYRSYYNLAKSDYQEPLTTHSDHFETNLGYSVSSYSKGAVFIEQLGYVVGAEMRDKILKEYYNQWRFKHPNTNDLIRIAEDMSGIKLDWYKEYWCNTIKTIDYGIDSLWEEGGVSKIRLIRKGKVPMPIDFRLTFKDSTTEMHYIPLNLMYGSKSTENVSEPREEHTAWKWTHPTYIVEFKRRLSDLKRAEIDPSKRMADIDLRSNLLQLNW